MVSSGRNRKRPYEVGSPGLMKEIAFPAILQSSLTDALIILKGAIKGYHVRRIYVDGGSSSEIMYEHCFKSFGIDVKSKLKKANDPLVGFSAEIFHALGLIDLRHMEQMFRIREQAILRARNVPNQRPRKEPMITEETWKEDTVKEKVTIHIDHLDGHVLINGKLSIECKQKLEETLRRNADVFAWAAMQPLTLNRRKVLREKVFEWLKEGIIRMVQYPRWVANAIPIKQRNSTWKMQIDYTGLNKVCAKDMYPFLEIEEELESLMGYQYKCFLRLPKEHSQVRMSEVTKKRQDFIQKKEFIPKLAELMLPIRNVRKNMDATEAFDWTNEATEAFQKIKRRKERSSNACFLCEPTIARDRNLLHFGREGGPGIGIEGRLVKWAAELRTYNVSYIRRKEAEGQVVKKFFRQGEQVLRTAAKNKEETSGSRKMLQEELILMPRVWRLYVGRETCKEGSRVGLILDSSKGKVYSYAIHLSFYASEDIMDYKALLARLVASAGRGMKNLHVFVSSKVLVDQVDVSRIPRTKETKKYMDEIIDTTTSFHRFRITHLPKSLNPKVEALTGLASIRLELLNQEVSVAIKTRPTVEAASNGPKEARNKAKKATTEKLKSI
ncbi:reverse transcriptase domain-containing protein [Tanacetum coccineum]|uniref:Reverse transcriptase domain-containing protein n=1 Tax=Tanacetum coccineum TaxID=301880 RepID=A0ABQ5BTJ3_9ASTR